MKRKIIGYHQDEKQGWVADLDCFHGHHVAAGGEVSFYVGFYATRMAF